MKKESENNTAPQEKVPLTSPKIGQNVESLKVKVKRSEVAESEQAKTDLDSKVEETNQSQE